MNHIVTNLFSWQFAIGMLVGFLLDRAWAVARVLWLERNRPLSGNRHRSCLKAAMIDPRWFAGAIAIAVASWSVFATQANTDRATQITAESRQFAADTRACQSILITAINDRAALTTEYNRLSKDQRVGLTDWLNTLLNPPADIAARDGSDPIRQQWAIGVTSNYFAALQRSQREQAANDAERARHPLPDPNC